jgi:cupin fold WbuC family metalloprotein
MITKIHHKKKLYALIVNNNYRQKKGINFFSSNDLPQQFGYIYQKKNHVIQPHKHCKRSTKVFITSEVLIILKGTLRVDFYDMKQKYLLSKILKKDQIIFLFHGAHGFKVIKDVQMIEVKQGPFKKNMDKIKFLPISEDKIKIK